MMSKSPPPPVTDAHTASPADAPKKPWTRPTIRTVDGEVRSGDERTANAETGRYTRAS